MGVAISLYGFHVHITQVSLSFSDVRKWMRKQPVKKLKALDIIYFSSILRLLSPFQNIVLCLYFYLSAASSFITHR